jgi:hypothetical protein|tara:strand:+ start:3515 stop:3697 length:183 start_codon:yes stop_codon:yes gene_type:complete
LIRAPIRTRPAHQKINGEYRLGFVSNVIRADKARLYVGIAVSVGQLFTAEVSGSSTGFTS